MLITTALQQVHLLSQGNTDYPTSGDDDFQLYLGLLNNAINIWEHQEGIVWNELMATQTGTILSGDATYNATSNYRLPLGQLFARSTQFQYSTPQEGQQTSFIDSSFNYFTVTGSTGAKVITLYPTPGDSLDGTPFSHPYLKNAITYITGEETTPLDMSDPYYAIHYAIGMVMLEDNPQIANTHLSIATQKLTAMRLANDIKPQGSIELHGDLTYTGFGR